MTIRPGSSTRDDRREMVGWLMYDWANSAFQTTVVTVLIGPYLTDLALAVPSMATPRVSKI